MSGAVLVFREIGERKRAQEALRESEERFRGAFEDTNVAMVLTDTDNRFVRVNAAFARLFGYSPPEMLGKTMAEVTHPDDLAESYARREQLLAGEGHFFQAEKRYLHRDGHAFCGLTNVSLVRDRAGRPLLYVGQVQDITERKRAEAERKQLEDQFRQAQKMEAVGRLAGGVAHDFNNLLTAIIGYGELVLGNLPAGDPNRESVREVVNAGERAAGLTRQLLAFSRKAILQPRVLDLKAVVADMDRLLRRIIGEDVSLHTAAESGVGVVKADPTQVEQVILNLAVNARDAMPQGGRLTIDVRNAELDETYARAHPDARPGPYVLLAVSDTGCGMDPATMARVFEPFFTTKGDKGTGLGLATVYGIAKQSGGHVAAYSEVGHGTTFKVYLPRLGQRPDASGKPNLGPPAGPRGGETVLLVEDEDTVRSLARQVLRGRGYAVLEARDGAEAVRVAGEHGGRIDLLVSDVVLPRLGGREAAERLKGLHAGLKVLFLSGYTDDAVVRHGILEAEVAFLQKPFTPASLAAKVREVLDG